MYEDLKKIKKKILPLNHVMQLITLIPRDLTAVTGRSTNQN